MERFYVDGITVGEMEKSAKQRRGFLEADVMAMVLAGGVFAECEQGFTSKCESLINQMWGTMVNEIDYAFTVRKKNAERFKEVLG